MSKSEDKIKPRKGKQTVTPLTETSQHLTETSQSDADKDCEIDYDHRECGIEPHTILGGKYEVISPLGKGAFCNVYLAVDKLSNTQYAVKVFKCGHNNRDCFDDEIKILTALGKQSVAGSDSDYIMKLYDLFGHLQYDFAHGHSSIHPCMVVGLYGGSVADIVDEFEGVHLDVAKKIFRQILCGLRFIHSNGVAHGDLSSSNIMIDQNIKDLAKSKDFSNIKIGITDFNLSKFITEEDAECVGTQEYCAPEVLLKLNWSQPADIWSAGCIFYELVTGCHLFNIEDEEDEDASEHSEHNERIKGKISSDRDDDDSVEEESNSSNASNDSSESSGGFSYNKNYTHLSGIVQLLGKPPRRFIRGGNRYFNSKGTLKHNSDIALFDLQKHLVGEFNFNKKVSAEICKYLFKMICYQEESRASANDLINDKWLN